MTPLTGFRALGWRGRGLAACTAILGATSLTIGLAVAPALADGPYWWGREQNFQTGLCLDSNYSNPQYPSVGAVYTNPCYAGGDTYQEWNFYISPANSDGAWWELQDQQTGLCLDSNYSNPQYPSVGAVYTDPCNGDAYQAWSPGGFGPGFTFQDYQTSLCLDSNYNEDVYTDPCDWNDTYQNWSPDSPWAWNPTGP